MIATEAAIALKAALQADRRDAPAVATEAVEVAIATKEGELGDRPLTAGQRAMAVGVATSGRGVELVVGVGGAGKKQCLTWPAGRSRPGATGSSGHRLAAKRPAPWEQKPASKSPAQSCRCSGASTMAGSILTTAP